MGVQNFIVLNTICYNEYMVKKCKIHGLVNHFERKDGSWRCGKCASKWVIDSRIKKKTELVKTLGGKCKICGYKRYIGALDFHHLDPSKKKFSLAEYFREEYWKISFEKEAYLCQKKFLESFGIDIKTLYPYLEL